MFDVAAESYDRFMGRYSRLLAPAFADFAGVASGRVLDVGCGPGALTGELVARVGAGNVAAVEPSEEFFAAVRSRYPGIDVRHAPAEQLPFDDGEFDAALAQLVVHFMTDPVAGLREMARVSRGTVAACVWDIAGGRSPMSPLWEAVDRLGLDLEGERLRPGAAAGALRDLFDAAGLVDVEDGEVSAPVEHATFDEWWEPFTFGVGPAGQALARLAPDELTAVREEARALLGDGPVRVSAVAWAARGLR